MLPFVLSAFFYEPNVGVIFLDIFLRFFGEKKFLSFKMQLTRQHMYAVTNVVIVLFDMLYGSIPITRNLVVKFTDNMLLKLNHSIERCIGRVEALSYISC